MMPPWEKYGAPAQPMGDPIIKPADPYKAEDQQIQRQAAARSAGADARAAAAAKREEMAWKASHNPDGSEKDKSQQAYSQSALDAFDRAIGSASRLLKHPGLGAAVGSGFDPQSWGTFNPITGKTFAGTDAANFNAELDALKAQVFLPMVQSMKGMGALSNAEGQKLTDAIGALDPRMSEAAFKASLNRVIGDLSSYRNRGRAPSAPAAQRKPSGGSDIDAILRKHKVIP